MDEETIKQLDEIEELLFSDKITPEEYVERRNKIIDRYGAETAYRWQYK